MPRSAAGRRPRAGRWREALDAPRGRRRPPAPADRAHAEGVEAERRAGWLIEQRRVAPEQGELAVRRAQLEGERAAERRAVERIERERRARAARIAARAARPAPTGRSRPVLARFTRPPLETLGATLERLPRTLERGAARRQRGGRGARRGAARLRARGERPADRAAPARRRGDGLRGRRPAGPRPGGRRGLRPRRDRGAPRARGGRRPPRSSAEDERASLARARRAARRAAAEALGPVNPLAAEEYREAVARVEELEAQRGDLETGRCASCAR